MISKESFKNPILAIDAIIHNDKNQILFIKRKNDPFKGYLSLPGGFVNHGEKVEDAIKRIVIEEVALSIEPLDILGIYSDPIRDPRDHIMSAVFICLIIDDLKGKTGDSLTERYWIHPNESNNYNFAFDHRMILDDYLKWRLNNSTYWSSKIR
jgi:8-oxo-dGTP diphosphatase